MESNTHPMATPQPNSVDVWLWIPCKNWTLSKLNDLSKSERTQFQLKPEIARWQFAASKLFQRHVLSMYINREPSQHVVLKKTFGKPYLDKESLQFNASHSQGIMLVAVTSKTEIGLDIAVHNHASKWKRRARSVLHENECVENATQFYHLWALKESLLKATGEGLIHGCRHLCLNSDDLNTDGLGRDGLSKDGLNTDSISNNSLITYTKQTQQWWSYLIRSPIRHASLAVSSNAQLNDVRIMSFIPQS
ncbi:4'-phosphopantetheinyl transferase superfamily protein [Vibrio penaeicida]|uniref:4'-phosphopantetheinyl transferase family protein n=1 Tax=Vibrio penaeicida TaxID=104609 RepID=UPI00273333E6|nr:4'-phosphopantetheinyl transferase superfamily protein [Vibrio penaeicida]MDP2571341.1 4'-phosphopantetheinyl transferase superfamily protein [Vibrio penaeicida]